jgi:alpha-beta hydrolase superfamily lysophospholipase
VPQLLDTSLPGFAAIACEPKASLIIVHGLAEYADRYREIAAVLKDRGVSSFVYDQIGHGDRQGVRTHVHRFEDFVRELNVVARAVRAHEPARPLFLWGHSMGSIVAALAAIQSDSPVAGVITSSNSLEVFRQGTNPLNPFFRLASAVAPRIRVPLGLDATKISADQGVQRAYAADPRIPNTASLRLIVEFAKACLYCREVARKAFTPWLIIHGEADRIAPPKGSKTLFDLLASTDKKLVVYPSLRHEVHNELPAGRAAMLELMTAWIHERATGVNATRA